MGADIVGWITCPLQRALGPESFIWKLKCTAFKIYADQNVPADRRAEIKIHLSGTNRQWHHTSYAQLMQEVQGFEQGIPECASCPISGGYPLGCYRYISYPIDEQFEQLVFDFFVSQLPTPDSICDQIFCDVVSKTPSSGTPWHTQRGSHAQQGGLAALPKPLVHQWGGVFSKQRIDSAQILGSLFITLDQPALVAGYTRFWSEFLAYADARGANNSRTINEIRSAYLMYVSMVPFSLSQNAVVLVEA